jgi:formamidopyrimidine-DNA glycosylase
MRCLQKIRTYVQIVPTSKLYVWNLYLDFYSSLEMKSYMKPWIRQFKANVKMKNIVHQRSVASVLCFSLTTKSWLIQHYLRRSAKWRVMKTRDSDDCDNHVNHFFRVQLIFQDPRLSYVITGNQVANNSNGTVDVDTASDENCATILRNAVTTHGT